MPAIVHGYVSWHAPKAPNRQDVHGRTIPINLPKSQQNQPLQMRQFGSAKHYTTITFA